MSKRMAKMVERHRWLKLVPNTLTLGNSICGFVAILFMLKVYDMPPSEALHIFATSSWIIICAMLFDVFDGFAARVFNAVSMHGLQMDSLADMVTFGVAPATVCAIMTHVLRYDAIPSLIVYALCAVYLGCAALRLATYNVRAIAPAGEKGDGRFFSGLPTPGAAAGVCSVAMLLNYLSVKCNYSYADMNRIALYIPVYAAVLGLLMVSTVPFPHAGKWFFTVHRSKKRMLLAAVILAVVVIFRTPGMFAVVNVYIFFGPLLALLKKCRRKPGVKPCVS